MKQNNPKYCIRKFTPTKRRAVAEVISSLLLVAITVVGAVILTTFLDEAFISGGLSASGSDSTIKTLKLIKYDSRDGGDLMGLTDLNNTSIAYPTDNFLCRESCSSFPNTSPDSGGTAFLVIQVENQSVNPIFLHNVWLGNVTHSWDISTEGLPLNPVGYPSDGRFSIFPVDCDASSSCDPKLPTEYLQKNNQIQSGQTVNLLIKLDTSNPDILLGKTIRAQFNIGANQLFEFLIKSGGAQ